MDKWSYQLNIFKTKITYQCIGGTNLNCKSWMILRLTICFVWNSEACHWSEEKGRMRRCLRKGKAFMGKCSSFPAWGKCCQKRYVYSFFQLYVIVFDVFAWQLSWSTSWSQRVFHFAGPLLLWFCFFLGVLWNAKSLPSELWTQHWDHCEVSTCNFANNFANILQTVSHGDEPRCWEELCWFVPLSPYDVLPFAVIQRWSWPTRGLCTSGCCYFDAWLRLWT